MPSEPSHPTPGSRPSPMSQPSLGDPQRGPGTATATAPPRPTPPGAQHPPPLHGPWPLPATWGGHWPGPARPASPATVIALLVAAAIAALTIPLDRPGIGWFITAIAGLAALIVARQVPYPLPANVPPPLFTMTAPPPSRSRFGWAAATVALLGVGTVRDAGWLFVLCLATALLTGTLAAADPRTLRGMIRAAAMSPGAALRGLPWTIRGLAAIRRRGASRTSGVRVAATIGVSVALLVVFGALFASADATFANLIWSNTPDVSAPTTFRWVFVFALAWIVLGGVAYLRSAPPNLSDVDDDGRRVARLEWATPLGLLVVLFAAFVAVQLTVLFGGSRHVLETDGLTYANYARGGFWQLLVATGLTLLVIAGAARWAPRETRADRALIRTLLGLLAALTLVIVASAIHRMDVYADTYGLTRLRLLVALCELWLGVVFVLVLIAGIRLRAAWLPRVAMAAGVLALLGLAAVNPDGLIADRNIDRYERINRIDTAYLSELSADAVPALDRISKDKRDCALATIAGGLTNRPDDWHGWNYGRAHARKLLGADAPLPGADCPGTYRD
jgi:uncharacterized protein DUF4153